MDYPLNADVHCTDGRFGHSTHLILTPSADKVTHIVVKAQKDPKVAYLIPTRLIQATTPDMILLAVARETVRSLERFNRTDFIKKEVPRYAADPAVTLLWPRRVPSRNVYAESATATPNGNLVLPLESKVMATDGRVGLVSEFIVSPETWQITHLVLREGLPWDKKQVTVPVDKIASIEDNLVYLSIDKNAVKNLPSVLGKPIVPIKK